MLLSKRVIVCSFVVVSMLAAGLLGFMKYDEIIKRLDFSSAGNVTHLPFQRVENGKWGMIGADGELLFETCFDNEPTVVINNRFYAKNKDGLWDLYSIDSSSPKRIGLSSYRYAGLFYADVAPVVRPGHCIEIIDRNGNVLHQIDKLAGRQVLRMSDFSESLAVIELDNHRFGAVDTAGRIVVQPQYDNLYPCHDGRMIGEMADRMVVLDKVGSEILSIPLKKDFTHDFRYRDGVFLIQQQYRKKKKWKVFNLDGFEISHGEADEIVGVSKNRIITKKDNRSVLSDFEGQEVFSVDGLLVFSTMENRLWNTDAFGRLHLMDTKGKELRHSDFCDVLNFENYNFSECSLGKNVSVVSCGMNRWTLVDDDGHVGDEFYSLGTFNLADNWLYNEQLDFNYLVSQLQISEQGLDGMTFESKATEVAMRSGDIDAINYTELYDIRYVKSLGKGTVTIAVEFSDQVGRSDGSFTDMKPDYFEVRFDDTGIFHRNLNEIFNALNSCVSHLKGVEHVEKQGRNAMVYRMSDRVSCVVYRNQFGVYLMMSIGDDSEEEMKVIAQDEEQEQSDAEKVTNDEIPFGDDAD